MKQVGFVSGGSQIFAGIGTCALSAGMACGGVGVPLMAQGANNVYESGYYLLFRKDKVGSIREAYHYAANYLGYNKMKLTSFIVPLTSHYLGTVYLASH